MTNITNTVIGPMTNVYKDEIFLITKHSLPGDVLIDIVNADIGMLNTDQAQFIVFRRGRVIGYDLEGNVVVTRNAGDTSDTSTVVIPEHGVLSIDANSEFYCIMKNDKKGVTREYLSFHDKTKKDIINKSGVLCIMEGEVLIHSHGTPGRELTDPQILKAPAFVRIVETDHVVRKNTRGESWIILVN